MTSYSGIANGEIDVDSPVTTSLVTKLRDNPLAMAEGTSGAPEVVGLTPMLRATANDVAALTFLNLPDNYDTLEFELVKMLPVASGANQLRFQVSTDNGASWVSGTGDYQFGVFLHYGGSTGSGAGTASSTPITDSGTAQDLSASSNGVNGLMRTYNFAQSGNKKFFESRVMYQQASTRLDVASTISVLPNTTSKVNAVRFFYATGNISSGYVTMRRLRPTV